MRLDSIIWTAFIVSGSVAYAQPPAEFDLSDYWIIDPDSNWHYTGAGLIPPNTEDDFTWTILAEAKNIHGVSAAQIFTTADDMDDDRQMDRDWWSIDGNGDVFFHGFFNGEADGGGTFPSQDVELDEPFRAGGNGQTIGDVVMDTVSIGNVTVGGFANVSGNARLSMEYKAFLPTFETPLGQFRDVLHLHFSVEVLDVTVDGPFGPIQIDVNVPVITASFFLKEGVGMVGHAQMADPNDAEIQRLDSGQVAGVPITADDAELPECVQPIADYIFGVTSDPSGLDLNGDGEVNIADILFCIANN